MEANKVNKPFSRRGEAMTALDEIHEKYAKLPSTDIEKFAPVYYPIAIVEMKMDEESFENFEIVQSYTLEMIQYGILDYEVIAKTFGLSKDYMRNVFTLLTGYGHIDENGITPLGMESLKRGMKITQSEVWQRFQVDALNGQMLKVDQTVSENMLLQSKDTKVEIGKLDYIEGMTAEEIKKQFTQVYLSSYRRKKKEVQRPNILRIKEVACPEVKFAKGYLVKMRNIEEPIIFGKRFDEEKVEVKERYFWKPFGISNKNMCEKFGFETDIPLTTTQAKSFIKTLYSEMLDASKRIDLVAEIRHTLELVYPFHEKGIKHIRTDGVVVPYVELNENAFMVYRTWVINFMIGIKRDYEYLLTHEHLFGNIISLRTDSLLILETADIIEAAIEKYGKLSVIKRLRDKYKDYNGDINIIQIIHDDMEKMVNL